MSEGRKSAGGKKSGHAETPALEWIAAAVGLVMTLGILGSMGWEAMTGGGGGPAAIEARVERIVPTSAGYVAEIALRNDSPTSAAAVQIEGELTKADGTVATSQATVDYVPGESTRRAVLSFTDDPRRARLEVRVLGFAEP